MNEQIRAATRARMQQQGLTQEQMAGTLGVRRTQVNRMLNGNIGMVPASWQRLLDALGLEVVVQAKGKDEPQP